MILAPSILSSDYARLAEQVAAAARGGATLVHVDVMDGHFVPNITLGPPIVASLHKATPLPLDVHLMIENADRYLAGLRGRGGVLGLAPPGSGAAPAAPGGVPARARRAGGGGPQPGHAAGHARRDPPRARLRSRHVREPRVRRPEVHPGRARQDPPPARASSRTAASRPRSRWTAAWTSATSGRWWKRERKSWSRGPRSSATAIRSRPRAGSSRPPVEPARLDFHHPRALRGDGPDGGRPPRRVLRVVRGRAHGPAAPERHDLSRAGGGRPAPARDRSHRTLLAGPSSTTTCSRCAPRSPPSAGRGSGSPTRCGGKGRRDRWPRARPSTRRWTRKGGRAGSRTPCAGAWREGGRHRRRRVHRFAPDGVTPGRRPRGHGRRRLHGLLRAVREGAQPREEPRPSRVPSRRGPPPGPGPPARARGRGPGLPSRRPGGRPRLLGPRVRALHGPQRPRHPAAAGGGPGRGRAARRLRLVLLRVRRRPQPCPCAKTPAASPSRRTASASWPPSTSASSTTATSACRW